MSGRDSEAPTSLSRPRESIRARVAVLAVGYAFLVLLQRSAEATSLSLFLDHLGAKKLPLTFVAASLLDVPLAFAYMPLARRMDRRGLLVGLAGAMVAVLAGARLLGEVNAGAGLFLAYLGATSLGTFLVIHWGVLLLDAFTVDESRRAFPLVYAAGHAGSFAAGAAMQLAGWWDARDLLVAVPALSWVGVAAGMLAMGRQSEGVAVRQGRAPRPGAASGVTGVQRIGLLAVSPLLRAIALSTALMMLLRLCLRILYGQELEAAFSDPAALTRFVGVYTMGASAVGLVLQLFATPRWLRSLGVGKLNLAYAGAALLSIVSLLGLPGALAATVARFTDLELKGAIKTPLSAMFYDALDEDQRADARAIVLGIVSPVASLASSLLLLVYTHMHAPLRALGWVALGVGVGYCLASAVQARAYRLSLQGQLVRWAREATGDPCVGLDRAVQAARSCPDARIADLAREIRRRRWG